MESNNVGGIVVVLEEGFRELEARTYPCRYDVAAELVELLYNYVGKTSPDTHDVMKYINEMRRLVGKLEEIETELGGSGRIGVREKPDMNKMIEQCKALESKLNREIKDFQHVVKEGKLKMKVLQDVLSNFKGIKENLDGLIECKKKFMSKVDKITKMADCIEKKELFRAGKA